MKLRKLKYGMVTMCVGTGQGALEYLKNYNYGNIRKNLTRGGEFIIKKQIVMMCLHLKILQKNKK